MVDTSRAYLQDCSPFMTACGMMDGLADKSYLQSDGWMVTDRLTEVESCCTDGWVVMDSLTDW